MISYSAVRGLIEISTSRSLEKPEEEVDAKFLAKQLADSAWFGPRHIAMGVIHRFVLYPIGRAILLIITVGKYPNPNKKHNPIFVANFVFIFFLVALALITIGQA
ncbi:hypothetical protein ACFQIB_15810 [Jeongeupia naejangsanensis]|uniref:Uncharacterized protein n=2 Tax=Jeongeupia naejangsanensis TaxID=613195 RepID=A0ABS2BM03_9NEIS|nr:hypothetical protein [Jeongeupia naejangsanensis]